MSTEFLDLLYLLSCSIQDKPFEQKECSDINKILDLAKQQGVWELAADSILKACPSYALCNDIMAEDIQKRLQAGVAREMKKNFFIYEKLQILENAKIPCCTLKGLANAVLYKQIDFRRSGDVDILINPDSEAKALEILSREGFVFKNRHKTYNETVCRCSVGVLEVHISPYDDIREKILFQGKKLFFEPWRKINIPGYFEINTLGYTDGLVFNVLHAMKHFLSSGVGIRQIMDILLYMQKYYSEINWDYFERLMKGLKYDDFIAVCIGIGVLYLGFDKNVLPDKNFDESKVRLLLTDIENGGVFGYNDDLRKGFYRAYINKISEDSEKIINNSYLKSNTFRKLFPSKQLFFARYPYCYRHKVLLPVAWINRIADYLRYKTKPKREKIIDERMKLMKEMGII